MSTYSIASEEDVRSRLAQFRRAWWTFQEVHEWYGIDLTVKPQELLAQYRIWAEHARNGDMEVLRDQEIDHWLLETFLEERELVPIRQASIRLALSQEDFKKAFDVLAGKGFITEMERAGDYPGVFRRNILRDIHARIPELRHRIFPDYNTYILRLHEQFENLGIPLTSVRCSTSRALGDDPIDFAYDWDVLANQPMGLAHQVWLDTPKPLQLRPDACSWLTYVHHEELLHGEIIGNSAERIGEQERNLLRHVA